MSALNIAANPWRRLVYLQLQQIVSARCDWPNLIFPLLCRLGTLPLPRLPEAHRLSLLIQFGRQTDRPENNREPERTAQDSGQRKTYQELFLRRLRCVQSSPILPPFWNWKDGIWWDRLGTPLYGLRMNSDGVLDETTILRAGIFDDIGVLNQRKPEAEIFTCGRVSWLSPVEGTDQFVGMVPLPWFDGWASKGKATGPADNYSESRRILCISESQGGRRGHTLSTAYRGNCVASSSGIQNSRQMALSNGICRRIC